MYWGWRPLVFYMFISVLVTACGDNQTAPTTAPTSLPPLTLTLRYYASPPPTATPVIPQIATLSPQFATSEVDLATPDCTLTLTDSLLCLGFLHNLSTQSLTRASVRIELYRADNTLLAAQIIQVPQGVIPAGESAPYHALFLSVGQYTRIVVSLHQLEIFTGEQIPLQVEAISGGLVGGRYRVEARVHNAAPSSLHDLRVVVTVYDTPTPDRREVVGYRVVSIDTLNAGESMEFGVEILPQRITPNLTHTVYAEVLR